MPSIYQIKPRFQALLRPLVRALAAGGITANQVTLAAAAMSVAAGIVLAFYGGTARVWLLLPVVLFVRMALNAIDGMLAREHGQKSALGAFLNELCDVVSDAALYLPFALLGAPAVTVLAVLASALTEMAGVVALQVGAERRYDGPMGKSDRAFAFGLLAFLIGIGLPVAPYLAYAIGAVGLLAAWTAVNRVRAGLAQARR
ncbi:MAG TPA: CDP-alcohol phosphatidyltransferase family protein [Dongiaceae bacterium]|jgi:CDP-diacylglycerol--glycerol-3-phosphate 3-phosphatidyltransferase|nr:CDP-alcohol phosphatidyltransferase family protein [Dongiaceae bacterium]